MEDEVVSMSSETFHKFLLDDPTGEMVDLLRQHRTFEIKKDYLELYKPPLSPSNHRN